VYCRDRWTDVARLDAAAQTELYSASVAERCT
jgi:hypothetical protein